MKINDFMIHPNLYKLFKHLDQNSKRDTLGIRNKVH